MWLASSLMAEGYIDFRYMSDLKVTNILSLAIFMYERATREQFNTNTKDDGAIKC